MAKRNPLIRKRPSMTGFTQGGHKSAGILDDFSIRKNVATKEGTIEKVPVNDSDIVNKKYVDTATANNLKLDASNSPVTGDLEITADLRVEDVDSTQVIVRGDPIDVGQQPPVDSGPINFIGAGQTVVDLNNPVNLKGNLTQFQVYVHDVQPLAGLRVCSFYGTSPNFTCRAYQDVAGTYAPETLHTITGLNIAVEVGDFIGAYYTGGEIKRAVTGGADVGWKSGDFTETGVQTYTILADDIMQMGAIGISSFVTITSDGVGSFEGDVTAKGFDAATNKITNVVDPTADQEAATKKYVDDNHPVAGLWQSAAGESSLISAEDISLASNDIKNVKSMEIESTGKIEFRDGEIFIQSNADGEMTIEADSKINIDAPLELTEALTGGGSGHDQFSDFAENEHRAWETSIAQNIHADNYTDTNTTYTGGTNLTLVGTTFNVDDAFLKNDAADIGVGLQLTQDNSSADTQFTPQVLYNTDATPPAASGFPIGTIYIQYTA